MATQPGSPAAAMPTSEDTLVRRLADLERFVRELGPSIARSFQGTVADLTTAQEELATAQDDLATQQADLTAAVAALTLPDFNQDGVNNYTITTASTTRKSVTFTVPDGYTRALVLATAQAMGYNSSGVGDYLYVQANVAGIDGGELLSYAADGTGVGLSALLYWELGDLSAGETFDVSVKTRTAANPWPAAAGNQANIYALIIYMR